ncbi:unnamed protein product [Rodentolepis nana]|uniref:Syndecan n=1 Tax=Rodentolepis nana TaxID=102285 RepID=A0A0R3TJM5_RODNA|nr:unnamed protein product [Rodentolepis nana]
MIPEFFNSMGAKHSHPGSVPASDHEHLVTTFTRTPTTTPHSKYVVSVVIGVSVGSVILVFLVFILCVYFLKRVDNQANYSPHEEESRMYRPKGLRSVAV